jgi:hypothetical protein
MILILLTQKELADMIMIFEAFVADGKGFQMFLLKKK